MNRTDPDVLAAFHDLVPTLGTDVSPDSVGRWVELIWARDRGRIDALLRALWASDALHVFPEGSRPEDINDDGRRYLCFRTHFLRYACTERRRKVHALDIRLVVAVALGISGKRAHVPAVFAHDNHGRIIDGTNVYVAGPRPDGPRGEALTFDGREASFSIGGSSVSADYSSEHAIVAPFPADHGGRAHRLACDGDFVFFYSLDADTNGTRTVRSILSDSEDSEALRNLLDKVKSHLRSKHPGVWTFVRQHVQYVSRTSLEDLISSTDTSEARGSVVLNDGLPLDSDVEAMAWQAGALYHEAKHLQLFDSKQGWVPPQPDEEALSSLTVHLSEPEPRIPCAWYGNPSPRNMGEHLISVQAFIPGLLVTLTALAARQECSLWTYDNMETVMRGVNGAMGALALGAGALSRAGRDVYDVVRRDYEHLLKPVFSLAALEKRLP